MKRMLKQVLCSGIIIFSGAQAWIGSELNGFYFGVDYLGWKAQEDQLQYALLVPGGVPTQIQDGQVLNFNFINQHFSFDSGVRLKAGYAWCDDWAASLCWTHFKERSCGSVSSNDENGLIAILFADPGFAGNIVNFVSSATSTWNLHFDIITADLRRRYNMCDSIVVDLYGGIAGARIHQKQRIAYTDLIDGFSPAQPAFTTRCNNFSGVGPYAGIDTQWFVCSNAAMTGSLSSALFVGEFCCRGVNRFVGTERTIIFPLHKHRVRPWFDLALGLEWLPELCDCMDLNVHIDFEAQYLPEQWQAVATTLTSVIGVLPSGGHLTTYGVTLGLDLLF